MAHVSKHDLNSEVKKNIERQLFTTLLKSKSRALLFEELVTDVERLMLAKRLAAVLMLIDEQSYYRIEQALGMSTSTTKRLHRMLVGGAFANLEAMVLRKKERAVMMRDVEKLIRAGLPPRAYVIKRRRSQ